MGVGWVGKTGDFPPGILDLMWPSNAWRIECRQPQKSQKCLHFYKKCCTITKTYVLTCLVNLTNNKIVQLQRTLLQQLFYSYYLSMTFLNHLISDLMFSILFADDTGLFIERTSYIRITKDMKSGLALLYKWLSIILRSHMSLFSSTLYNILLIYINLLLKIYIYIYTYTWLHP